MGFLLFASSLFLILIVLVQRGRGGGLTGALGGMGGQSAFGARAGDTFTRITVVTAIFWILLSMLTIKVFNAPVRATEKQEEAIVSGDETFEGETGDEGETDEGETDAGVTGEGETDEGETDEGVTGEAGDSGETPELPGGGDFQVPDEGDQTGGEGDAVEDMLTAPEDPPSTGQAGEGTDAGTGDKSGADKSGGDQKSGDSSGDGGQ